MGYLARMYNSKLIKVSIGWKVVTIYCLTKSRILVFACNGSPPRAVLMKQNPLIHFAYTNFEEGRGKFDKCHQIDQKLTDITDMDPTLTFI